MSIVLLKASSNFVWANSTLGFVENVVLHLVLQVLKSNFAPFEEKCEKEIFVYHQKRNFDFTLKPVRFEGKISYSGFAQEFLH